MQLGVDVSNDFLSCSRRRCVWQFLQLDAIKDALLQYRHFTARGQYPRRGSWFCDFGRKLGTDCAKEWMHSVVVIGCLVRRRQFHPDFARWSGVVWNTSDRSAIELQWEECRPLIRLEPRWHILTLDCLNAVMSHCQMHCHTTICLSIFGDLCLHASALVSHVHTN